MLRNPFESNLGWGNKPATIPQPAASEPILEEVTPSEPLLPPSLLYPDFNFTLYICTSRVEWGALVSTLPASHPFQTFTPIQPGAHATTNTHGNLCAICFDLSVPNISLPQWVGLIAHECWHALTSLFEAIGEHKAGEEITAYLLQSMVQGVFGAFPKDFHNNFTTTIGAD